MTDHHPKPRTWLIAPLLALTLLAGPVLADVTSVAPSLFVILYKQGPGWKTGVPMKQQEAIQPHYQYMKKLFDDGVILYAGPTLDEPGGVVILKAHDLGAATALMEADPSISSKMFEGEIHSWSPTFSSPNPLPQPGGVHRSMKGNVITSDADPVVQITLPAATAFVGSDSWVLQAYWDQVTLYTFADADASRNVQRLYWVQFEAYLSNHPELHHSYDSTRHVTLGGMDFLVDTWTGYTDSKDDPDSDTAHLKGLLAKQAYALPRSMMTVRFVHLMDDGRKELMYIYKEPTPAGLTADDLKQGGKAFAQWAEIEKGLIERGQKSIQLK